MADIKSFREIAMERIASMGEASEEDQLKWKYLPEGEKLAASCLNENREIKTELEKYDKKAREYILKGAEKVFISNINVPKNEAIRGINEKAMHNLQSIKKDKNAVKAIYEKINYIFEHYDTQGKQQREQSYELLKQDFQNKIEQALAKQLGTENNLEINVEALPQFQEEWRKATSQLDNQYNNYLNEYKQELREIE
ncbi:MAG: hypothetical protein GX226_02450 [Dehalococcoidales bacterium]|nr:hypothetical protein [Dehalococcoidales bacterium]